MYYVFYGFPIILPYAKIYIKYYKKMVHFGSIWFILERMR